MLPFNQAWKKNVTKSPVAYYEKRHDYIILSHLIKYANRDGKIRGCCLSVAVAGINKPNDGTTGRLRFLCLTRNTVVTVEGIETHLEFGSHWERISTEDSCMGILWLTDLITKEIKSKKTDPDFRITELVPENEIPFCQILLPNPSDYYIKRIIISCLHMRHACWSLYLSVFWACR